MALIPRSLQAPGFQRGHADGRAITMSHRGEKEHPSRKTTNKKNPTQPNPNMIREQKKAIATAITENAANLMSNNLIAGRRIESSSSRWRGLSSRRGWISSPAKMNPFFFLRVRATGRRRNHWAAYPTSGRQERG